MFDKTNNSALGGHSAIVQQTQDVRQLFELAADEHSRAMNAANESLQHAIAAGDALLQAKRLVGHGEWEAHLKSAARCRFEMRTGRQYMYIAEHKAFLGPLKSADEAISVRRAVAHIQSCVYLKERIPGPGQRVTAFSDDSAFAMLGSRQWPGSVYRACLGDNGIVFTLRPRKARPANDSFIAMDVLEFANAPPLRDWEWMRSDDVPPFDESPKGDILSRRYCCEPDVIFGSNVWPDDPRDENGHLIIDEPAITKAGAASAADFVLGERQNEGGRQAAISDCE